MSSKTQEALPPPPPTYIFREHNATVTYVYFFDNDQFLASSDEEGWIIIWKLKTRRPILKWQAHKDNCLKVTTTNNNRLISQGRDNMIHIWQLPCLLKEIQTFTPEISSSIVYDALGFCKFSCYDNQENTLLCFPSMEDIAMFDIYDVTHQRYMLRNIGQDSLGKCMAVKLFKVDTTLFVVAGYESGKIALWEIKGDKSQILWQKAEHAEPILDLSIDGTHAYVISSSADNQICKYSLQTGDIIKKITIKKSGFVALKIRPDNKIFAAGGFDGKIRLFSLKSMKPLAVLSYHRNTTYSVDFSFHGNSLVASSQDQRISLWNIF